MIEVTTDDKYWARRAVIAAAITYVDYFFPLTEDGVGLDGPGGELIRASAGVTEGNRKCGDN